MLVGGDLGLWRPVLVVVVGVVFLVLRRQWRLSAARKEEISRLLVLASEESARAELESTAWYGIEAAAVPASGLQQLKHQCAVCFCPTTTRCSQCKAVRYCSGKCQIIHWRQGHKQECRPLETFDQSNEGGGSSQKVFNQEEYEYCGGGDTHSGSSSSSGWSVEGSSDSLSESSMPSPGFWDGHIDTRRFGIDTCDDFAQSSPVDSGGDKMSEELCKEDPRSMISSSLKYREINSSSLNAYCVRPDASDVGPRITKDAKINSSAPSLRPEKPENVAANTSSFSHALGTEDFGSQLGRVSDANLASGSGRDSGQTEKPSKVVGGIHALSPEKSNYVVPMDTRSFSYASRTQEFGSRLSKSSDANLTSGSQRESGQNEKPSKVDGIHALSPEKSNNVAPTNRSSFSYALRTQDFGSPFGKGSNENLTSSSGRDFDQTEKCTQVDGIHGISSRSQNSRNGLKTSMLKVVDQLKPSKLSRQYYPSGAGRETPGRYSVKGLFPYELFVKLYNWNKAELHPCGLINCGNSCYANAVLQCLVFTPPLTAYFLQGLHSKACEKKDWCFTCEFESLILKAKESNSPVSPIRILSQIENIGSQLGYGRQEDAHEFLRYAIDTMQSICLKEVGVETLASSDEEKTIVGLTFGGYLRSKIKCMNCGGKSERHERMMDLTVEIDGNICTLEAALRQFTGTEILDGENKYKCSRCKSYEKAKKKLTIVEAPNVLTIALKRFQSGKFGKLSKPVKFPEVLDMTPYMMNGTSDKSPIYRLYGVVVHLDIMNASFSGHYVCYVKNIQNKWFKIDDSSVKAIELVTELTKGAYMLFYARCSPRPQKVLKSTPRKPKNPSLKSKSHSTFDYDAGPRTDRSKIGLYPNRPSYFQRIPSNFEEDSTSSDYSSSSFFSEPGSCSPESSTKDSISADDYFDQIFGDLGHNWNSPWRNSSDSDTSSLSPSPSPEGYSGHSTFLCSDISEGNKENGTFLCSDMNSEFRKLDSSSSCRVSDSCRETNLDRLGRLDNMKSGIHLRRSMRGRTE